jgi:hypothetical protein
MSLYVEADFGPGSEHSNATDFLRLLGQFQTHCATKAQQYRGTHAELSQRFERASFAAMNARVFGLAAVMAEREQAK